MAQMGNQLDNLQSLTVINNNNTIRLPDFGISYIPPKKEPLTLSDYINYTICSNIFAKYVGKYSDDTYLDFNSGNFSGN